MDNNTHTHVDIHTITHTYGQCKLYLILSDDAEGVSRFSPFQHNLLLIHTGLDRLQRNFTWHWQEVTSQGIKPHDWNSAAEFKNIHNLKIRNKILIGWSGVWLLSFDQSFIFSWCVFSWDHLFTWSVQKNCWHHEILKINDDALLFWRNIWDQMKRMSFVIDNTASF